MTPEQYAEVLERAANYTGMSSRGELQEAAAHLRALAKAMREAKENRVRGVPPNDQLVGYWIPLLEAT